MIPISFYFLQIYAIITCIIILIYDICLKEIVNKVSWCTYTQPHITTKLGQTLLQI